MRRQTDGYLALVFLGSVLLVGADVVHQVSFFILVFVTVLRVLQEVERLQNVPRTPVGGTGHTEVKQAHSPRVTSNPRGRA